MYVYMYYIVALYSRTLSALHSFSSLLFFSGFFFVVVAFNKSENPKRLVYKCVNFDWVSCEFVVAHRKWRAANVCVCSVLCVIERNCHPGDHIHRSFVHSPSSLYVRFMQREVLYAQSIRQCCYINKYKYILGYTENVFSLDTRVGRWPLAEIPG